MSLSTFSIVFSAILVVLSGSIVAYSCLPHDGLFIFVYAVVTIILYFVVHWFLTKKIIYKLSPVCLLEGERVMLYRIKGGVPVFFKQLSDKKNSLSKLCLKDLFFQYIDIPTEGFFGGEFSVMIAGFNYKIFFKVEKLFFVSAKDDPDGLLLCHRSRYGAKLDIERAIESALRCVFEESFKLSDSKLEVGISSDFKKVFLDELNKLLKDKFYKANIYKESDYRLFDLIVTIK